MECKTCINIKRIIDLNAQYSKTRKHDWGITKNKLVCSPVLLTVAKWNGKRSWENKGSIAYGYEPLNYCPACGKPINRT